MPGPLEALKKAKTIRAGQPRRAEITSAALEGLFGGLGMSGLLPGEQPEASRLGEVIGAAVPFAPALSRFSPAMRQLMRMLSKTPEPVDLPKKFASEAIGVTPASARSGRLEAPEGFAFRAPRKASGLSTGMMQRRDPKVLEARQTRYRALEQFIPRFRKEVGTTPVVLSEPAPAVRSFEELSTVATPPVKQQRTALLGKTHEGAKAGAKARSKVDEPTVRDIRDKYAGGMKIKQIQEAYPKLSVGTVEQIAKRLSHLWVK